MSCLLPAERDCMNLDTDAPLAPQRRILDRWLASLCQLSAVELVWLTGSLAAADDAPGADIDMRFAIADAEYDRLWKGERRCSWKAWASTSSCWIAASSSSRLRKESPSISGPTNPAPLPAFRPTNGRCCSTACRRVSRSSTSFRSAALPRSGPRRHPRSTTFASRRAWSSSG
jgi:hypothetical protein